MITKNNTAGTPATSSDADDGTDSTTAYSTPSYYSPTAANNPYRPYEWYLDGYLTAGSNQNGANVDRISPEYSGHGVKVGIIDAGFDLSNVDLAGRFDLALSYD